MTIIMNSAAVTVTPVLYPILPLSPAYHAILRVAHICASMGIEYQLVRLYDGWQLNFYHYGERADVIEHFGSYGSQNDLMETYGFPQDERTGDGIAGYLPIIKVLERIFSFCN